MGLVTESAASYLYTNVRWSHQNVFVKIQNSSISAPINVHYESTNSVKLEPGYFLSVGNIMSRTWILKKEIFTPFLFAEPGYYSESYFGIRLENVLEVVDKPWLKHMSSRSFLGFVDVSLVPFEPKLINRTLLNSYHVRTTQTANSPIQCWLNFPYRYAG